MKDLFLTVVEVSLSTSLIILILLIFSSFLNKRFAAKWKYLIWIMVALRLVIPLNFRLPVQRIVVDVPAQITAPINVNLGNAGYAGNIDNAGNTGNAGNAGNAMPLMLRFDHKAVQISLLDIAACLWLAGSLLFLSVHIFSYLHFRQRIARESEIIEDDTILSLICRISGELRIKPDIQVVRYSGAGSPMIVGFFKPLLVLPDYKYSEEELYFILKHELVHLKRKDIYFKLLFVAANAVHWFNPLVYFMQKEAEIDMELSCDERVLQRATYAVREAYTETLLSTLNRQYKRGNTFTTQFYGGKSFMEKRFKNILSKSAKRNGVIISLCAVCLMLVPGMLVGCSVADHLSSGVPARTQSESEPFGIQTETFRLQTTDSDIHVATRDMQTQQDISEAMNAVKEEEDLKQSSDLHIDALKESEDLKQNMDSKESLENVQPDEADQIKKVVEEFAAAYFSKDADAVKSLLPDSYAWDIEAYEGTGTISDVTIKDLPEAEELAAGSVVTVSLQYRDSTYEDMFQYLTVELIKQSAGWEIQFYGLEG